MATAYANNHHYDLAIQTAEKGITLNPKCIYCNSAKGFAYYETGKYAEAVTAYSKAIDFSIQQKHEKTYTKFSSRCEAYIGLKDFEKAFADCNRAIKLNKEDPWAYKNRAKIYLALNKKNKALKDAQIAEKLLKKNHEEYMDKVEIADLQKVLEQARI